VLTTEVKQAWRQRKGKAVVDALLRQIGVGEPDKAYRIWTGVDLK
jgi:hypothetical protein